MVGGGGGGTLHYGGELWRALAFHFLGESLVEIRDIKI